jgi:hypothetical protein
MLNILVQCNGSDCCLAFICGDLIRKSYIACAARRTVLLFVRCLHDTMHYVQSFRSCLCGGTLRLSYFRFLVPTTACPTMRVWLPPHCVLSAVYSSFDFHTLLINTLTRMINIVIEIDMCARFVLHPIVDFDDILN